jgi:hypothetical protein
MGYRQNITGDKSRNGQQHSRPGQTLGRSEYRRGIFDQSHRGQKAVHRPVQRIGIAADRRRFDVLVCSTLPLGGRRGAFGNVDRVQGNF